MGILVGTQASLRYAVESTRGTAPGGNWKFIRATGRNINGKKDILESAEVSTTRQRSDVRHGFNRVEGDIGFEFSLNSYDELLAYAMARSHVATDPANNTAVTANNYNGWLQPGDVTNVAITTATAPSGSTPGVITFQIAGTATTTHWIDLGFRPGDWVVSSGYTTTANNSAATGAPNQWKVLRIEGTNGGGDLVCQIPVGYSGQATEAAGAGKTIALQGRKMSIGTTLNTVSIERAFIDGTASDTYQVFNGCAINTLSMSIRPDAIVGGTFGFIGMKYEVDLASTSAGTPTVVATNAPFSAFDGSVTLTNSSGVHTTAVVTGVDFTLDNQRTLFPVVGSKYSYDVYEGVAKVTGTVTLLLDGIAQLTAFQDEQSLGTMVIRLNELGTTSFYSLVFHKVKYLTADMDPPQNGPVVISCSFEALEQVFTGFAQERTREAFRIQRSSTNIV